MSNSKKTAAGCGNIRKKIIRRGGKEYEYWEARYTVGFDPGTGKQVQKSVSGKTQKEVADILGISQSYISRLEKKIMIRLKKEIVKYS